MAAKWSDIAQSEQFQTLSTDQKQAVRGDFFDRVIRPAVPQDQVSAVQGDFFTKTEPDVFGHREPQEPANEAPATQRGLTLPTQPQQPQQAAEPANEIGAGDFGMEALEGGVTGVGSAVGGTGDFLAMGGEWIDRGLRAIGAGAALDAGDEALGQAAPSQLFQRFEQWMNTGAEQIDARQSQAFRDAVKASTPKGDLFKPKTWSFGDDPSVVGYGAQLAGLIGQFAPQAATLLAGTPQRVATAMTLMGGAQAGGSQANEAETRIKEMSEEQLSESSGLYRDLREGGLDHKTAQEQTAKTAGAAAFVGGAPMGAAGGALTSYVLGPFQRIAGGGLAGRIAKGIAIEAPGEGLQEVGESMAARANTNLAIGGNQDITEGSFGEFTMGAMFGGGVGIGGALGGGLGNTTPPRSPNDAVRERTPEDIAALNEQFDQQQGRQTGAPETDETVTDSDANRTQTGQPDAEPTPGEERRYRSEEEYQQAWAEHAQRTGQGLNLDENYSAGATPEAAPDETPAPTEGEAATTGQDADYEPGDVVRVPTERIQVDPATYQFRSNVGESGTDTRLNSVREWDDRRAGNLLLHERLDGSLYAADGHHRIELAQRLNQPGVNAQILREADGYSVEDVRKEAALGNIAAGNATGIDAAKVFRNSEGNPRQVAERENLPDSQLVRDGANLANLSDDVFGSVVNGQLSEKDGAAIGQGFDDPAEQLAAVQAFQTVKPQNANQRALLVNEIRQAGFAQGNGEQGGLFGEDPAESLIKERVKVMDKLRQNLVRDKRLFASLNANATTAEGAGNRINRQANDEIREASGQAIDLLDRAATNPDINAEINRAARRVRDGESLSAVTRELRESILNGPQTRTDTAPQDDGGSPDSRGETAGGSESDTPRDATRPADETEPAGADEEVTPGLDLESYTEGDIAERERTEREAREAEDARRREEEQRAQADAEADDFRLAGSNRPADVATAGGQTDLLGAAPTREPEPSEEPTPDEVGEPEPTPPPHNSTAPEHARVGVDGPELEEIVTEFRDASADMYSGGEQVHHLFDAPAKQDIVRLKDKASVYHREHGWMTPAEAKARIAEWKEHTRAQGGPGSLNADKVVLSLFDYTGSWSRPWEEAGYQVYRFDIQDDPEVGDVHNFSTEFFGDWFGDFDGQDIYAILAACPCTDFASSGSRHFAAKDADGRTVASVQLVHQTLATIEHFRPSVWAIENPVGRIEKLGGLPPWRLSFDPNHLGDPYTKKTLLWGRFNGDMPVAPVEPTEGSKMHSQYGGNSLRTKNARSATPEGFAYGFFMANNAVDHPAMAIANKYDRLDRGLIEQAVAAGVTSEQIDRAVEDPYYIDLDDAAAETALRELIAQEGLTRENVVARRAEVARQEIERDINAGEIDPASVRSFADLNDQTDANLYVNDADREDNLVGDFGRQQGFVTEDYIALTEEIIAELDNWIASDQFPRPAAQETAATGEPIVEHTTKRGRQLRGVVRDIPLSDAKKIDPAAFRKNGGVFIRENRLPTEDTTDATQEGQQPQDNQPEREEGAPRGQTAETGGSDSDGQGAPQQAPQVTRTKAKRNTREASEELLDAGNNDTIRLDRLTGYAQPGEYRIASIASNGDVNLRSLERDGGTSITAAQVRALARDGQVALVSRGLRMRPNGEPYSSEKTARLSKVFRDNPGATVEPTEGGYGVRLPGPVAATPATSAPEPVAPETETNLVDDRLNSPDPTLPEGSVGRNAQEIPLYEDENGARYYYDRGVRLNEPVGIVPGRGFVIDESRRVGTDFETVEEAAAREQRTSTPQPPAAPAATTARDLGLDGELFHGTSVGTSFDVYDDTRANSGVGMNARDQGNHFYLTASRGAAEWFATRAEQGRLLMQGTNPDPDVPGAVLSFRLDPETRVLRVENMPRGRDAASGIIEQARADGYQAIAFPDRGFETIEGDPRVFDMLQSGVPESIIVLDRDAVTRVPDEPAAPDREQFANNTLFTQDKVEAARARLKARLGTLNSGLDPEMLVDGMTIAGAYIESGIRDFSQYATAMVEDLGEGVRPFLLSFWEGARNYPGLDTEGMTSVEESARLHAALLDTEGEGNEQPTQQSVGEQDPAGVRGSDGGRGSDTQPGTAPTDRTDVEAGEPGNVPPTEPDRPDGEAGSRGAGTDVAGAGPADGRRNASKRRPTGSGARTPDADTGGGTRAGADTQPGSGERPADTGPREPDNVSPADPGPGNFHYDNPLEVVGGGQVARFNKNKAAIETFLAVRDESRQPTAEEQTVIAGYTGWGSFGQELFQGSWANPQPKSGWEARDQWLRDHLGESEWKGMQRSIINAHYTDPPTVMAMWSMLDRMGFKGGRVLEPSMGIGNFFGMMPRELKNRSQLTGIELDPVTGGMAQMLYPESTIRVMGYQESQTPDNFYDVVIGNWPFENSPIADRKYNRLNPMVHDYFFLKTLDQVRPGGIVMGISSAGSMDKRDPKIRRALASKGELVAAFRLPTGAFQEYAGTKVVTDIVILRKRPEPITNVENEGWIQSLDMKVTGGTVHVNEYYQKNPEHVIGELAFGHGTTSGRPGMIVNKPAGNMQDHLNGIIDMLPSDMFRESTRADTINYVTNHTADREGALTKTDDGFFVVRGEHLAPAQEVAKYQLKSPQKTAEREAQFDALIAMRQQYAELITAERDGDPEPARKELKRQYQAFRDTHGPLNKSYGLQYMRKVDDPFYYSLAALEAKDAKGNFTPATILDRSTMRGAPSLENPNVREAFVMARNVSVNPALDEIAERANVTPEQAKRELIDSGAVFELPGGDITPADIYLSGNVRQKMREAQAALRAGDAAMQRNIDALNEVMPTDIPYFNVEVQMGATWIPTGMYAEFIAHMLNRTDPSGIDVTYNLGRWKVRLAQGMNALSAARSGYGTSAAPFSNLVNAAISNQTMTLKTKDSDGNEMIDREATDKANAKIAEMRERFGEWLWSDPERRQIMEREYNEVRNAYAVPRFDGSFMNLSGMALSLGNGPFNLRQHQQDAIWRALVTRRSINAHEVGTGKSFTIAGIAVESRRYGIAKKPLILAHNANSKSVASDISKMYPAAKVLYLDNLDKKTIDVRMRQIANDDWDAIVVPHSLIDRLAFKEETLMEMAAEEIETLENEAREAASDDGVDFNDKMLEDEDELKKLRSPTAKDLVKMRNRIIESIRKQAQRASRANAVPFEDLGIDMVLVDEAHEFKKPPFSTKMRMKGLQTSTSDRSIALSFMTRYVRRNNGGGNVHTFTGTVMTNTLTEMFHQMRYVMDEDMKEAGVDQWDGWFGSFAKEEQDEEMSASGDYETVTRLRSFINVPELRKMVGQFMDVVFAEDMPEMQPRRTQSGKLLTDKSLTEEERAELLNGRTENASDRPYKKVEVETADLTPDQQAIFEEVQRLDRAWKNMDGKARKEAMAKGAPESPIVYEGIASRASFDARMARGEALAGQEGMVDDHPDSKISRAIANILEVYNSHAQANQVVFTNTGLGTSATRTRRDAQGYPMRDANGKKLTQTVKVFSPILDMVERLTQQGIPREQIAIVDGSTNKDKRKEIADAMNEGTIRVVIGSTQSLGVGVNMQRNLRAMHHLDAPYMPGDLEQRNGRGHRQGNQWNTVREYRYITDRLDGRRWQILDIKQRFITNFMKSDDKTRVLDGEAASEEESDILSTFAEAAGDPRILIRERLRKKVDQLHSRERLHGQGIAEARQQLRRHREHLNQLQAELEAIDASGAETGVLEALRANAGDAFTMNVDGKPYSKRADADEVLKRWISANMQTGSGPVEIGTYGGYTVLAEWHRLDDQAHLILQAGDIVIRTKIATVASLEATLRGYPRRVSELREQAEVQQPNTIARLESVINEPFARADELERAQRQLESVEQDMDNNPVPPPAWLRSGAAVGTAVRWNDQDVTVTGHRWTENGWYVIGERDTDGGELVIPYLEARDNQGMQIYDEREFEPPEVFSGDIPKETRNRYKANTTMLAENPDTGEDEAVTLTRGVWKEGRGDEATLKVMARFADGEERIVNAAQVRPLSGEGDLPPGESELPQWRSVVRATGATPRGISVEKAKEVAAAFMREYNGNIPLTVRVERTQEALYGSEGSKARAGIIKGAYHPGRGMLTLAAANLQNPRDAWATLRHEVLGHYGLNTFKPDEKRALLDRILETEQAKDLRDIWSTVRKNYADSPRDHQAEEVFAHLAEIKQGRIGEAANRILSMFRRALRRAGLVRGPISRGELLDLIRSAEQGIRTGQRAQQTFPATDSAQFSRTRATTATDSNVADQFTDLDEAQAEALNMIGPLGVRGTAMARVRQVWDRAALRIRAGMVDKYAALKELDEQSLGKNFIESSTASSSWILARMAPAAQGALHTLIHNGRIRLDPEQKVIELQDNTDPGLRGVLDELGESAEVARFFGWIAGNRAEKLAAQGRENYFTTRHITALMELNNGRTKNGQPRRTLYPEVLRKFQQVRDDVLAIADQSGLLRKGLSEYNALRVLADQYDVPTEFVDTLDKAHKDVLRAEAAPQGKANALSLTAATSQYEQAKDDLIDAAAPDAATMDEVQALLDDLQTDQRDLWANEFYVPFYRVLDENTHDVQGPAGSAGLSRQRAYKRLKGADMRIGDLLENTLLNFHHLLSASLKNQAAMQAITNAEEVGIAREIPASRRDPKTSTFILRDGQQVFYEISDDLVYKALVNMTDAGMKAVMDSSAMKMMRWFKRMLTNMVTVTPQFVGANALRDAMSSAALTPAGMNPLWNMAKGGATYAKSKNRAQMIASGASFNFGHLYGDRTDELKAQLNRNLRLKNPTVLLHPAQVPRAIKWGWLRWNQGTEFAENVNRAKVFETNLDKGKLYAAFQARDLMDFSAHGSWFATRFLIDTVPFLNARIQGLDKLYRDGFKPSLLTAFGKGTDSDKIRAKRFSIVAGALSVATVMLYMHNQDDEDYRELDDWMKDTYWFFKVGDKAFFIPKPFEVGAIATMFERMTEQFTDPRAGGDLFRERLWHMLTQTFAFSPVPQAAAPMLDVYANRDPFRKRPIEPYWDQQLSPSLRYRSSTTYPARWASKAMEDVAGEDKALSPLQIDYLINGYFGSVGGIASGMADTFWRNAKGIESPNRRFWTENKAVSRFYRDLTTPAYYTRYQTLMYEGLEEANRVYSDLKKLEEMGALEEARDKAQSKADWLRLRPKLNKARKDLSEIGKRMDEIRGNKSMDGEYKRRELERLRVVRNRISEVVGKDVELVRAKG